MKTDFDHKIKSLYDSGEFEYKEENWEKLKPKLNGVQQQFSKRETMLTAIYAKEKLMIAASIILLLGLNYFWFSYRQGNKESVVEPLAVEKQVVSKDLAVGQSAATKEVAVEQSAVEKLAVAEQAVSNVVTINNTDEKVLSERMVQEDKKEATTSIHKKSNVVYNKEVIVPPSLDKKHKEDIADNNKENFPSIQKEENVQAKANKITKHDVAQKVYNEDRCNPIDIGFLKPSAEKNDAGFSIQGSAGRGNDNSMYAAGIAYQVNLGKRFFVDGAVAINSSSLKSVVRLESETKSLITNAPGTFAPNDIKEVNYDYVRQNANYANIVLQPSLGYALTKRLALKAGVDLQQRIINANELSFVESNAVFKPLPNFDVGITPAVALKLNTHWQTNFIYRKGVTSKLSKKDYYDRSYFQVLLGYKF